MKAKTQVFLWLAAVMLLVFSAPVSAQVGGLTNTGNMNVCLNSTEPYGVVLTPGSTYTWTITGGTGGAGVITNGGAPNNLISVNWTSPGTCTLQVVETTSTCTGEPVSIQITILPGITAGIASADQTICYGTSPLALAATEPAGGTGTFTYQWELSVDGGSTWASIEGANELTLSPGTLTQTTRYHLIQTSASCGRVTTNQVIITVLPQIITTPIYHN